MIVPHRSARLSYVTHTIKVARGLALIVHVTIRGEVHSRVFKTSESFALSIRPHIADARKNKTTKTNKIYYSEQAEVAKCF